MIIALCLCILPTFRSYKHNLIKNLAAMHGHISFGMTGAIFFTSVRMAIHKQMFPFQGQKKIVLSVIAYPRVGREIFLTQSCFVVLVSADLLQTSRNDRCPKEARYQSSLSQPKNTALDIV